MNIRNFSCEVALPNCFVIAGYRICTSCETTDILLTDPQSLDWRLCERINPEEDSYSEWVAEEDTVAANDEKVNMAILNSS